MEAYLLDWAALLARWLHLITGIAWIGASFYFIWLNNTVRPPEEGETAPNGVAGGLWAIHGGGFYYVEKYKVAPQQLPEKLHWFKYEAYFTWLTGILLLMLVYYLNAGDVLHAPDVLTELRSTMADRRPEWLFGRVEIIGFEG